MNINRNIFKKKTFIIHLLIWVALLLLPFIFSDENQRAGNSDDIAFRNLHTATIIFWMGLFYLNAGVLVPSFIYRKRYLLYIVSCIILFCIIMLLQGAMFPLLVPNHQFNFFRSSTHNLIPFLFTIAVSTTYQTLMDKMRADALTSELQKENLKSELSFLRSQISPHFLFNVLNNIVAMVRIKSEDLEPTVIKLSALLQYMLYETDEKVLIKKEVEYLQNYIDLQQMRFSSKLAMQVHFDVKEEWEFIEPMLLVPFIENAFKHGNGLQKNPEIHISLKVENGQLDFEVKNKFVPLDRSKDRISGIGLSNVKRRLALLYENKHTLRVEQSGDWFIVNLHIILGK